MVCVVFVIWLLQFITTKSKEWLQCLVLALLMGGILCMRLHYLDYVKEV